MRAMPHCGIIRVMNEALLAVIALGVLAGGAIVVVDSLILRRIRRQNGAGDNSKTQR
jgi:hypothetical protein